MPKVNNLVVYATRYVKGKRWNQNPDRLYKEMECRSCGQYTVVGEDAVSTLCHECVAESLPALVITRRQKSDKPRGWQWMSEYVHTDGTVYHKGVEQPELKGTLPVTKVEPRPKLNKKQKERLKGEAAAKLYKLKKQIGKATSKRQRKQLQAEINRQSKIVQGKFNKKVIKDFLESK